MYCLDYIISWSKIITYAPDAFNRLSLQYIMRKSVLKSFNYRGILGVLGDRNAKISTGRSKGMYLSYVYVFIYDKFVTVFKYILLWHQLYFYRP
jgi:hypothetical protein